MNETSLGKTGHRTSGNGNGKVSRKESRKQDRDQKKQRKADFFTSARVPNTKRSAEHEHDDSPIRKRVRLEEAASATKRANESHKPKLKSVHTEQQSSVITKPQIQTNKSTKSKSETALQKLVQQNGRKHAEVPATAKSARSEQEKHEDAYIAYLESKLGWTKRGTKTSTYGRGMEDDGLDGTSAIITRKLTF